MAELLVASLEDLVRASGLRQLAHLSHSDEAAGQRQSHSLKERQQPLRLLLRELRLNDAGLQDQSVALLVGCLAWLRASRLDGCDLEVLELAGNRITAEGVEALCLVLEDDPHLRRLVLSRNRLRVQGGAALQEGLSRRPKDAHLLHLELKHCSLMSQGALRVWAGVLDENARVKGLDLSDNTLHAPFVEAMLSFTADHPRPATLQELVLLPNPCGSRVVQEFLAATAPWSTVIVPGATLEALEAAQLLHCLGPGPAAPEDDGAGAAEREFCLWLPGASLLSRHWQWCVITDALRVALTPRMSASSARPVRLGQQYSRHGGTGGHLRLSLDGADLSQVCFKVPRTERPSSPPSASVSIARSARRQVRMRASSQPRKEASSLAERARNSTRAMEEAVLGREVHRGTHQQDCAMSSSSTAQASGALRSRSSGSLRAAPSPGSQALLTPSGSSAASHPAATRDGGKASMHGLEQEFTHLFERHGYVELEVATVLRELRNVDALRLLRCGLKDNWLAQLGHSSKWRSVRLLDLRHNLLTFGCSAVLATLISAGLEALILDGNHLQAHGFEVLSRATRAGQRCSLRLLSLAGNDIGHPGGKIAAELLSKTEGCPLQGLNLADNPMSSGELALLLRALPRQHKEAGRQLQWLDLSGCSFCSALVPNLLRALSSCEGLCMAWERSIRDADQDLVADFRPFVVDRRLLL